jgi:hypothetical protein
MEKGLWPDGGERLLTALCIREKTAVFVERVPWGRAMAFAKPQRTKRMPGEEKRLAVGLTAEQLSAAAEGARYSGSPYHRPPGSLIGPSRHRLFPQASKCDIKWTLEGANRALKNAIHSGQVSADWDGGFPRWVWIRDGHTLYEARLSNRGNGEYHAYPLNEEREWPVEMR